MDGGAFEITNVCSVRSLRNHQDHLIEHCRQSPERLSVLAKGTESVGAVSEYHFVLFLVIVSDRLLIH